MPIGEKALVEYWVGEWTECLIVEEVNVLPKNKKVYKVYISVVEEFVWVEGKALKNNL